MEDRPIADLQITTVKKGVTGQWVGKTIAAGVTVSPGDVLTNDANDEWILAVATQQPGDTIALAGDPGTAGQAIEAWLPMSYADLSLASGSVGQGHWYFVSQNAGKLCPESDLVTGNHSIQFCVGVVGFTDRIRVEVKYRGVRS